MWNACPKAVVGWVRGAVVTLKSVRSTEHLMLGDVSLDWLKGKLKPETVDFPMKYRDFPVIFPTNPLKDGVTRPH